MGVLIIAGKESCPLVYFLGPNELEQARRRAASLVGTGQANLHSTRGWISFICEAPYLILLLLIGYRNRASMLILTRYTKKNTINSYVNQKHPAIESRTLAIYNH